MRHRTQPASSSTSGRWRAKISRMSNSQLGVFISSRMRELHNERVLVKSVLEDKGLRVFAFESDAGARLALVDWASR